jgi:ATP-binding cassette subfamily C (CFTR/MRP) protein 1
LVSVLFIYLRLIYISIITLKGSEELHLKMIERIIKAPINLYHDITNKGSIINQLSKDLGTVDFLSSVMFGNLLSFGSMFIGILIITSYYQPFCLLFLPLFLYAGLKLLKFYLNCCRPLINQESKTHQPIINLIFESYDGRETIKAYEKKEKMYLMFIDKIDNYILINDFLKGINVWYNFMLETMNLAFRFFLFLFILVIRNRVQPEIIGLLFIYTFNIQDYLIRFLYSVSMFENSMMALNRCLSYTEIIQEHPSKKIFDKNLDNWPTTGNIQVKNLNIKYRPDLYFVLKNLNFSINSKEKIGICGRTGSGKTTLLLSLLRIIETNNDGIIEIDGVNIANLGLDKIRENIAVVPQEPVIFNDNVRFNLDPEGVYSDEDLMKIIEYIGLEKITDLNQRIDKFSQGEKQLICIGRVCLKGSKILLLDEATSFLDGNTEQKTLKMLYEHFYKESTVICVSHRLNTLKNCDRIFVFNDGVIEENDTFQNLKNNPNSLFNQLYKSSK